MKSVAIVLGVAAIIVSIALVLTNLATSDVVESDMFTDPATATAAAPTATATPSRSGSPTPTPVATTTTGIPASVKYFPPFKAEMDIGQSVRFVTADRTSRNIKLLGTDLVFAHGTVTVWSTATIEVSGQGLEPIVQEIPAAYFRAPVVIHDVRIWIDITKEFNDRRLRDGGGTASDARIVLSDARLPLTDIEKFEWPYPGLTWHEGSSTTYWQGLQGSLLDTYHHGAIDMGMPENTPVHAWANGIFEATDRGFDWLIALHGADGNLPANIVILHLLETEFAKNEARVQKGEFLGLSGQANWYHTHLIYGYELSYMLAEWYMASATPEQLSYISDWLVAGPYLNQDDPLRLQTDYLGNEASVNPAHGDGAAGGRQWRYWDDLVPGVVYVGETVNPFPYSGWSTVNGNEPTSTAYLTTYVNSTSQQQVILNLGASDAIKVWVGSEEVLSEDRCIPGALIDGAGQFSTINLDEFQVPVTLDEGWNRIMLKTSQRDGCPRAWQISMRISDASGAPVDGLVVDALRGEEPPPPVVRPVSAGQQSAPETTPVSVSGAPIAVPTPTSAAAGD